MIRLHDTLTESLEDFIPQKPDQVSLYTCGPTVYNEPLIGNWVAYIRWDLLVRVLRANNYTVKRVMNITDVGHLVSDADDGEDKMQKGAAREGVSAWDVAERYTNRFLEGMTFLNLLPPEIVPKATEHIKQQVELIQRLEAGGHTYVIDDGVYFDTSTFPRYADFAQLDLTALRAGARVTVNNDKRHPSDFALWKISPTDKQRDMEWDSPWGKGFPGWHIECSAMALEYLGETIDIHTGGIDHIPVHHTNEIAQSEAATGKQLARYWLHANFLQSNGTKISKSLGNGFTLDDLVHKGYDAMDFKMFVMQSHYRSESNFTWENLEAASVRMKHWQSVACLRHQFTDVLPSGPRHSSDINSQLTDAKLQVIELLGNDLNSPAALTYIERTIDSVELNDWNDIDPEVFESFLQSIDDIFGFKLLDATPDINDQIKEHIVKRSIARDQKNWALSDEIRDTLTTHGIGISDTPHGARWFYL